MKYLMMIALGVFGFAMLNKHGQLAKKIADLNEKGIFITGEQNAVIDPRTATCNDNMQIPELLAKGCIRKRVWPQ